MTTNPQWFRAMEADEAQRQDRLDTIRAERRAGNEAVPEVDPRDPDPSRPGIFRYHNCWKCKDGALPCANGNPQRCKNIHARND